MKSPLRLSFILLLVSLSILPTGASCSTSPSIPEGVLLTTDGEHPQSMRAIILQPADSVIDGLPLLSTADPNDTVAQVVYDLFRTSFMKEAVRFYYLASNYVVNTGGRTSLEPAYLLLSDNQGGFPRSGFYLSRNDSILNMEHTPFIDLVKKNPGPENSLGSMTQIYPHEMGHIIFHLLSADSDSLVPASVDIHYSTLTTDYATAFNEGFAMHFENMARALEPDEIRKKEILDDFERKKERSQSRIGGFTRDFLWPLRFGFYRLSMLAWYQTFEDVKRYEWVRNNRTKFMNKEIALRNPEKALCYRNAGTAYTDGIRPLQQALATEGVVASFFYGLVNSEAGRVYLDSSFYMKFLPPFDTGQHLMFPDPVTNMYMKIFDVLHHHVNRTVSTRSQLLDFVDAYVRENPEESGIVARVFRESTGHDYPVDPKETIWITNPGHTHGVLVMDQTGGLKVPFYSFNLNAATVSDLITFPDISRKQAALITGYILQHGPMDDLEALKEIPGLDEEVIQVLYQNRFDPEFFEALDEDKLSLSLNAIFISLLKSFLLSGLGYGFVSVVLGLLIIYFSTAQRLKRNLWCLPVRYLGILFLAAAAVIAAPSPPLYFLGACILIVGLMFILYREPGKRKWSILTTLPMVMLLLYALI